MHRRRASGGRGWKPVKAKEKGNCPECRCSETKDIGEYDTCPHGCVYCYAVQNRPLALERFRDHYLNSEFLFPPSKNATEVSSEKKFSQSSLFDKSGGQCE